MAKEKGTLQLTAARLAANRRNARKSTGPRTAAGRRRVALNKLQRDLIPEEVQREMQARGEDPGEFLRLHRDLIALFRPGDLWERGGVETLAVVWWKKARRIRDWVGAGEARCEDLDRQLDEMIRLLLLMQSAQHRWWKVRLYSVLGYGLRGPEEVRRRIERRLFAFGGQRSTRSYPRPATREETMSAYREALDQLMAEAMAAMAAGEGGIPDPSPVGHCPTGPPWPGGGEEGLQPDQSHSG